ncbi:GTP-binding protein [Pelagibacterium xiamenense]|uniref:GTP-binding protein n=1 Tax=Pelagibacterium xiamenense TaxID=2901140 RepID=UPI0034E2AD91
MSGFGQDDPAQQDGAARRPQDHGYVNGFGDVPLDNDLFGVDGTASDLIEASTGCICCEPGNDIVSTLPRLLEAIDEVGPADRVVIERRKPTKSGSAWNVY